MLQPYSEWPVADSALKLFLGGKRLTWHEARGIAERMLGPFPLTMDILASLADRFVDEDKAAQDWGHTSDTRATETKDDSLATLFGSGNSKSSKKEGINTMETLVDKCTSPRYIAGLEKTLT